MSTNVNRPWLDVYDMNHRPVTDPARVMGPARPVGLSPNLFAPWGEAVGSGRKPKGMPKPKTTKNKRRMQKASRKANRKKR